MTAKDIDRAYQPPKPPMVMLGDGSHVLRAGMLRRLLARILDAVILTVSLAMVVRIAVFILSAVDPAGSTVSIAGIVMIFAGAIVGYILYEALFISRSGSTPGKEALSISVVEQRSGNYPKAGNVFGRFLLLHIPYVNFLIQISCFFYPDRRGWHDRASGTIVIREVKYPVD